MQMLKCLLASALFFMFFSCDLPTPPVSKDTGSAQVSIVIGKIGALAKKTAIELDTLYVTLSAPGETTIEDKFPISGNSQQTITKTYDNLASLVKTWTLTAVAKDVNGVTIHSGSTSFVVPARDVIPVTLDLAAQYSMLKANFYPIRDSVTRCELLVDAAVVDDSSFAKQSCLGDTVKLAYDYLSASPSPGKAHAIRMDVYGDMWGLDTLLYSGETAIDVISGQNASYTIVLNWVGPSAPPPGAATMTVVLGAVGTVTINGEIFKPVPDTWYSRAPDPIARSNACGAVVNGKLYVIGGHTATPIYLADCEVFDPSKNSWSMLAPMPTPRACPGAAVVNGKLYVIGGSAFSTFYGICEEYDPATDTWTSRAPMPTPRHGFACAVVNGKIYAIGGHNGVDIAVNEVYDPATDTWASRAAMPSPRASAASGVVDNKIYVIGGRNYPAYSTANEVYDPATDTWSIKPSMPTQRDVMISATADGKIHVMGGSYYGDVYAHEVFDTYASSWATMAPLPFGRSRAVTGSINGLLYVVGGYKDGDNYSTANDVYCLP